MILTLEDLKLYFIIGAGTIGAVTLLLLILVIYAIYLANSTAAKLKSILPIHSNYGHNPEMKPQPSGLNDHLSGYNNILENPRKLPRFDKPTDSMAPIRGPPQNMGYDFNKGRVAPPDPRPFSQMSSNSRPLGRNDFRNEPPQFGGGPRNPIGNTSYGQPPRGDFREPNNGFSGRNGRIGY